MQAQHRIDVVFGKTRFELADVSVGLRDEHVPGDAVVAVQALRVDRLRLVPHRGEPSRQFRLVLCGFIFDF